MMNTPRADFLKDFQTICSKSADENALKKQLQTREKYNSWFNSAIHEKVLYLDQFSSEEKKILQSLNPLFSKWISSKSMVTSLKIQSKAAEVKQDGKQHFYLQYLAEIGVVEDIEDRKHYQLHVFDFSIDADGRYFCKKFTNREGQPKLIELGNSSEYIHSTAELIIDFLNERDNFADVLDIDVKLWSQRHELKKKFSHVRKICMVHNSPSSTHWWMRQVDVMTTIPEVTISNSHKSGEEVEVKNCEVIKNPMFESTPLTFPLKKRQTPVWVDVLPHCEHPLMWAQKLNIETNVENPLSDLSKMSSLTEVNMCRLNLDEDELTAFLRMWSLGHMGHRLERVSIETKDMTISKNAFGHQSGVKAMSITQLLCDEDSSFSEEFKKAAQMKDAEVFLVRRLLPAKKNEREHRNSCLSDDSAISSQDGLDHAADACQQYGAFALVQLTETSVHFTAVRNPLFARELKTVKFPEAAVPESPRKTPKG